MTPTDDVPTMRAAVRRRYGGPEQVTVETLARPEPGPGQVLVRVRASGIARATLHLLEGKPYLARLALGLRAPRRAVLGEQVAGEIVALGAGVQGYAVGDRVCGAATGALADYAVADPGQLAHTPAGVTDVQAATLGISGMTALDALTALGDQGVGRRVLVLGASGGVGSFAVQLAAHRGARVTGVCSAAKADLVRDLGAAVVADYRTTRIADLDGPFDVIVDIAGNRPVGELRSVLSPDGALVIVGGEDAGPVFGGLHRNLFVSVADRFTRQRLGWIFSRTTSAGCAQLADLVAAGALHPAVERTVGLEGVADALEALARGELRGQIVVRP